MRKKRKFPPWKKKGSSASSIDCDVPIHHHIRNADQSASLMADMTAKPRPLLSDLAATVAHVPSNFVRPIGDRPNLQDVQPSGASIPLIDIHGLDGPNRSHTVHDIGQACQTFGFFQVMNHGVPEGVAENMMRVSREFFHLPESEGLKSYSDDPLKATRLSKSFNVKTEKVANWRDYLRLHCHPLDEAYIHEWPTDPPSFKEDAAEYCRHMRGLSLRLLEAISESLGLERDHIEKVLGRHGQHMAINDYPRCPEPELTYGLPGHADPNVITLLLQDDVPGLQARRDGKWVAVDPIPNTFTVSIGDQIQVISNDRYRSVLHRAVVNCDKERMSIPTFYCPSPDAVIGPAPQLAHHDRPPHYTSFTCTEYHHKFWNRGLSKETCLDMFKA